MTQSVSHVEMGKRRRKEHLHRRCSFNHFTTMTPLKKVIKLMRQSKRRSRRIRKENKNSHSDIPSKPPPSREFTHDHSFSETQTQKSHCVNNFFFSFFFHTISLKKKIAKGCLFLHPQMKGPNLIQRNASWMN